MFVLNIPQPCHENWNEMTPEKKGRFCGSCQKIVVDFTQMSDEQVKNYLLSNVNTCGRFYASQIGRPLENKSLNLDPIWYQQLPFARQVFYAFAVYFLLGVSSCDFDSQTKNPPLQDSTHQIILSPKIDSNIEVGEIAINNQDSIPPPKVNKIGNTLPVITGDVILGEPAQPEVTQGAPVWQEPLIIDTTREILGKIAAPKIAEDSIKN